MRVLFMDMNAYFASVEQQVRPELRGKPVGIVAVNTDSTCCIAASYEAKKFGIKTGTIVGKARRMCPALRIVEARPALYVRYHHAIIAAVETCLHVDAVHSIDEMSCRLMGQEKQPERAAELARTVKVALRSRVGEYLRCSIGLAPNRFLAKVAADMQKPDGLTVINSEDLPARLYRLKLDDFPGIGPRMLRRLNSYGVHSVEQLCALSEKEMKEIWHSVVGQVWWQWLRGEDPPEAPTHRRTVGHSHVLPPDLRNDPAARAVLVRMIHKAAARLRRLRYWARQMSVQVDFMNDEWWQDGAKLGLCQDTLTMLEAFAEMWQRKPAGKPLKVGVTLFDLVSDESAAMPLFAAEQNRVHLAQTMDQLNERFGPHTVYFGSMYGAQNTAPMRISFTSIPDLDLPV